MANHIILLQAENSLNITEPELQIAQNDELIQQLIEATEPQVHSLFPNDLQISTRILSTVIDILEDYENETINQVCLVALSHVTLSKVCYTSMHAFNYFKH